MSEPQTIESRQVVHISERLPTAPSRSTALLNIIERASRDPSVDIAKLRELITLQTEIKAQENQEANAEAMKEAQAEMRPVVADAANPQTKSKYASYAALDRALRPIYTGHGFSLTFDTADGAPPEHVRVVCDVSAHGHTRRYHIDMPADGKGAKGGDVMTKTHATGSAVTYGRRYLLQMIFNIAVGEDDDGNAASDARPRITQKQADALVELLEAHGKDRAKFLKWAKVQRIEEIPAAVYQSCVDAITAPVRA